jgi:ubiquinone/menaquinone biosynthesis C-methylase UbiE
MGTLGRLLPYSVKTYLKTLHADWTRDELTPPNRLIKIVGSTILDFKQIGENWVQAFVREAKLQPTERVLDLGSGCGRSAVALTKLLTPPGSYEGLEIVRESVDWCQAHITPKFPNFKFTHADVFNRHYNTGGKFKASEYRLPFRDDEFDFVFLTSIYTHLVPDDARQYLSEIYRVLKPGGRCFNTFALLTDRSRKAIADGTALGGLAALKHEIQEGCLVVDPKDPEYVIAYPEERVVQMYTERGFVKLDIRHGNWCGTPGARRAQDIVIAFKP